MGICLRCTKYVNDNVLIETGGLCFACCYAIVEQDDEDEDSCKW